ncbi:MAG: hypothetical protein R2818_13995 [Flavobacteriales bacterium]
MTGANGCTSSANATVTLDDEAPGATAEGGVLNCNMETLQLMGTGNGTYAWSGPNNFSSTEQNPTIGEAGSYTLVVTGANGCTSEATAEVTSDINEPVVSIQGGMLPCEGGTVTLIAASSIEGSYLWAGPNGFSSTEQSPIVSEAGVYTLVVTASNGCDGRESVDVEREECGDCPPMITSCPADITVECAEDFSPYGVGGAPEYREGDEEDEKGKKCPKIIDTGWWDEYLSACPFVIRRHFYAVDEAGNLETCEQLITVTDEVAPIFENVPSDLTISCDGNLDDIILPEVWAYDECTKTEVPAWMHVEHIKGDCPSEYSIVHTWTATDYCGNTGTAQWTIHVIDNEAPTLDCDVQDMKVCCEELPEVPKCSAKDNCDPEVMVYFSEEKSKGDCEKGYVVVRTWTAMDACGNTSVQEQTIQVMGKNECKKDGDEAPLLIGGGEASIRSGRCTEPLPWSDDLEHQGHEDRHREAW